MKRFHSFLLSFFILQLKIDELDVAVGAGLVPLDLKQAQGADEGRELGEAEVSHVEIGEPLCQLVSQLRGKNPAVVVGTLLHQGEDRLLDGFQICLGLRLFGGALLLFLRGGRLLLLRLSRGNALLLLRGEKNVQIFKLVAG